MPETEQERREHGRVFVHLYCVMIAQNDRIRYITRLHNELERLGVHERLIAAACTLGFRQRELSRRFTAPEASS